MSYLDLPQLISAQGVVRLPGSKSISNRVLLLAALAAGKTEIHNLLQSDDTARMLEALRVLGVRVISAADNVCHVEGCGGRFSALSADLFLGNAGTAFRPLTAVLALSGGEYTLSGTPRMHERPIADLVEALRQMGANVDYLEAEGFPPLRIHPAKIVTDATIKLRGNVSSQFLTGILMALPLLGQRVRVEVTGTLISRPYVEMTLAMMARFGVIVEREDNERFVVPAESHYVSPGVIHVEGDASSASYFLALGAAGGGPVRVEGVGRTSVQGDIGFVDALAQMGATVSMEDHAIEVAAGASRLRGIDIDCNAIPDAAMTLATLALFAEGTTILRNIASWRVKETDRISAMAKELTKLGVEVEAGEDFLRITPPSKLFSPPEGIDTYDDHRMAMCFSLAALGTPLRINDPACVAKTFPDYFSYWSGITMAAPVIAIDGPSASGKGSVAMYVAQSLGWHYLDSGVLYRLVALAAQREGVAWDDETKLAKIAARLDVAFSNNTVQLAGTAVDEAIRSELIASGSSQVAALPAVREALLFRQRLFRCAPGLVADGRDMGSVVFPDAALKVFLTARVEVRAERRYKQLIEKGIDVTMASVLQDLRERDERDTMRPVAPLRQSAGAELLDTSDLSMTSVIERILDMAVRHCKVLRLPSGK